MYSIDIDIGGTFTDGFFSDGKEVRTEKVLTTPHDITECFMNCVVAGSKAFDMELAEFLRRTSVARVSTTVGTNLIVQRAGPKLGLIVTEGHQGDLYGSGTAPILDHFVRADMVYGVREAVDDKGKVAAALDTEELLLAVIRKPDVTRRSKQRAADQLITIWDDAALEIDDFAPLLESAWHARNRINSAHGTLLGASETFLLVAEDCSLDVLEFFGRDGMSPDESMAFEEFLFNMTSEELAMLRRAMQQQKVSSANPAWAAKILGRQIEELEHSHEIDPMALYRSYQRRQLAADFRLMSGAPGPRRTAEGYLLVYLLDQQ